MTTIKTVGMLGLGKMGCPMARHIIAKGYRVVGYDPLPEARSAGAAVGARIADSPREVSQASELVIIVVGFDSEVESALYGRDGVMEAARPGLVVAIGSTIAPRTARRLAARALAQDVALLDIPLTRGEAAALAGKLLILGAGNEDAFEACRPVFDSFASDIFHLGAAGAGQTGKMVNNLILWACTAASDEGLRLGEALGVDPEKLRRALHHSSAQNWAMDERAGASGMPWAEKDMMIVLAEADQARLSLPLSGTIKEVIKGLKIRLGFGMPTAPE